MLCTLPSSCGAPLLYYFLKLSLSLSLSLSTWHREKWQILQLWTPPWSTTIAPINPERPTLTKSHRTPSCWIAQPLLTTREPGPSCCLSSSSSPSSLAATSLLLFSLALLSLYLSCVSTLLHVPFSVCLCYYLCWFSFLAFQTLLQPKMMWTEMELMQMILLALLFLLVSNIHVPF